MKFLLPFCLSLLACTGTLPVQENTEVRTRLDLAERRLMMGSPRQALSELQAIRAEAIRTPRYHYDMGMAWLALNDAQKARLHLAQAVKLKPDYGQAWNNLGLVCQLCRQPQEAAHAFHQALKIPGYTTPELAACNLARLYQQQGSSPKALAFALKAIHFNRGFVPALLLAGNLYTKADQPEKALACLQQAAQKDPDNTAIALLLGRNLISLGQKKEARTQFSFVLQNGNTEEIEQARQYIQTLQHK